MDMKNIRRLFLHLAYQITEEDPSVAIERKEIFSDTKGHIPLLGKLRNGIKEGRSAEISAIQERRKKLREPAERAGIQARFEDTQILTVDEVDTALSKSFSGLDPMVWPIERREQDQVIVYDIVYFMDEPKLLGQYIIRPTQQWASHMLTWFENKWDFQYPISEIILLELENLVHDKKQAMVRHTSVPSSDTSGQEQHKVSEKVQKRAYIFKSIKDENPDLSQQGVATRANRDYENELEGGITADTVRNAYRAMDWSWERADKIR